jgi:tetratricopeptide (TPR) repeat protein
MSVRSVLLASVCAAWVLLPTASVGLATTPDQPTVALVDSAYKALAAGDLPQAISGYTTAIESRQLPVETLANALLNRGLAYQRRNEFEKAIDDYTAALGIDAMDAKLRATALYNRALAYQHSARPALAIEDFTGALFLDPKFAHAYYGRGNVLRDSGQYLFALSDFEKAIRYKYPQPYLARFGEGLTQEALKRPQEARRAYMQALADNPNFAPARNHLAELGGIAPLVPVLDDPATNDSDGMETSSVTPSAGGTVATSEPVPTIVDGSMQVADSGLSSEPSTQTTVTIEPGPGKLITDRVPAEEDKPAGLQPVAEEKPEEKVIAIEPVPAETPEPVAEASPVPEPAPQPEPAAASEPELEQTAEADINSADVPLTGWAVQISSQSDEKVAWNVWKKLKAKHKILAQQKPVVMKADLGSRVVYRLRLAGFEDQNSARGLCSKLKSRGVSCYVSKLNS